jgi:hypothetical protein
VKKDPTIYLSHILESISPIETYTAAIDLIRISWRQQTQNAVLRRKESRPHVGPTTHSRLTWCVSGFGE